MQYIHGTVFECSKNAERPVPFKIVLNSKIDDSNKEPERPDIINKAFPIAILLFLWGFFVGIPDLKLIIWAFISFWSACSEFADDTWEKFLSITGDDHFTIWVTIPICVTMGTYWIYGGLYFVMDITLKPAFMRKYKVQPGTNEPLDMDKLKKGMKQVLFNQFLVEVPLYFLLYPIMSSMVTAPVRPLPHFHTMVMHYLICVLCQEITFYYSHRFLHSKYVFKYIHKKHHQWTAPIALMAAYSHPLEHVLSNIFPVMSGILVTGCHPLTAWMWASIFIMMTENFHSGYHIPFFTNPEFHDFHHASFNNCFGTYGLCDWLHGTDTSFRRSKAGLRSRLLFGFKSARELYPDDKKDDQLD